MSDAEKKFRKALQDIRDDVQRILGTGPAEPKQPPAMPSGDFKVFPIIPQQTFADLPPMTLFSLGVGDPYAYLKLDDATSIVVEGPRMTWIGTTCCIPPAKPIFFPHVNE